MQLLNCYFSLSYSFPLTPGTQLCLTFVCYMFCFGMFSCHHPGVGGEGHGGEAPVLQVVLSSSYSALSVLYFVEEIRTDYYLLI